MGIKNWFKKDNVVESNTSPASEPYISIIGDTIDPTKGIELKLDWNDEFIQYLRSNNFTGTSDELVIQKWLQKLSNEMSMKLYNRTNNISEFE